MTDQEEPNSVPLVSNDGFTFIVRKTACAASPAIKSMLDKRSSFSEALENPSVSHNMKYRTQTFCLVFLVLIGGGGSSATILEKVCEYFYYHENY
jgi:transcription elongation factor B subunit 1